MRRPVPRGPARGSPPRSARSLARVLAGAAAIALGACAAREAPELGGATRTLQEIADASAAGIVPLVEDAVARPDLTLIIPVAVREGFDPSGPLSLRTTQGTPVPAALWWIGPEGPLSGGGGWLAPEGDWRARPSAPPAAGAGGSWAAVLALPASLRGQDLRIGDRTVRLLWLEPGAGDAGPALGAAAAPAILTDPALRAMVEPEGRSPLRRWRVRLLEGTLWTEDAGERRFEDPIVEALAVQTESRWRATLARLAEADRGVAARLARRLALTVQFEDGPSAPAWPIDEAALDALQRSVLREGRSPERAAEQAEAFLAIQPRGVVWIIDDAGARDAVSGGSVARLGAANFAGTPVAAAAEIEGWQAVPQLAPIGGGESAVLLAVAPAETGGEDLLTRSRLAGEGRTAVISFGQIRTARPVLSRPMPAMPPGLRLGPLAADHTMASWLTGAVLAPELPALQPAVRAPARLSAGLVYRELGPDQPVDETGWTLYLECLTDPESGAPPADADADAADGGESYTGSSPGLVRVWLGPYGTPSAVLRVAPDGNVKDERTGAAVQSARVRAEPGKWSAWIAIPPDAIEPGLILRVGIERVDDSGERSAWPRPMLPWDAEPARAAVDLRTWDTTRDP